MEVYSDFNPDYVADMTYRERYAPVEDEDDNPFEEVRYWGRSRDD